MDVLVTNTLHACALRLLLYLQEFSRVIDDLSTTSAGSSSTTLAGISVNAWISLFMGAAVSAVFAFVLSIITIVSLAWGDRCCSC